MEAQAVLGGGGAGAEEEEVESVGREEVYVVEGGEIWVSEEVE